MPLLNIHYFRSRTVIVKMCDYLIQTFIKYKWNNMSEKFSFDEPFKQKINI